MNIRHKLALFLGLIVIASTASVSFGQATAGSGRVITGESFRLVCIHKIQIAAQSDGLISELLVDEGYSVDKGATMLKIDNRVAQAELDVAIKELEAAQKQAEQMAEIEYAQAAFALAEAEYEDEKILLEKQSSTFAQARRKGLEAQRARLQIDVAKVKHETEVLAVDVSQAKANAARVQLGLFDVIAPYDGVVVERLRDQGEWIRAGEPVLKINHMNEMKVQGYVSIAGISLVELENAVMTITVDVTPTQQHTVEAPISFVSSEIEATRVRVSARIKNERVGNSWLLRDGTPASVSIRLP